MIPRILANVPNVNPNPPRRIISMSFVIQNGHGRTPNHFRNGLLFQNVSISNKGGNTKASMLLARAPTSERRSLRSGTVRASTTEER